MKDLFLSAEILRIIIVISVIVVIIVSFLSDFFSIEIIIQYSSNVWWYLRWRLRSWFSFYWSYHSNHSWCLHLTMQGDPLVFHWKKHLCFRLSGGFWFFGCTQLLDDRIFLCLQRLLWHGAVFRRVCIWIGSSKLPPKKQTRLGSTTKAKQVASVKPGRYRRWSFCRQELFSHPIFDLNYASISNLNLPRTTKGNTTQIVETTRNKQFLWFQSWNRIPTVTVCLSRMFHASRWS